MAASTTIPRKNSSACGILPTVSAGNMSFPSLPIRIRHRHDRCGWMRKAESPPVTMFTAKTLLLPSRRVQPFRTQRSIYSGSAISRISAERIGRYACRSMSILPVSTLWKNGGRRNICVGIWDGTLPTAVAGQEWNSRRICPTNTATIIRRLREQAISTSCMCITALNSVSSRRIRATNR